MKRKALWAAGLMFLISSVSLFGQWATVIGGGGHERARSVCRDKNGAFLVMGEFSTRNAYPKEPPPVFNDRDMLLWKLDSTGKLHWTKSYGGSRDDAGNAMEETSDRCYVVAGQTNSFGKGGYDFWVLKLSSNGEIKWQKTYGGSSDDFANAVQETIDGGYILAGTTNSYGEGGSDAWILKLDPLGEVEWQKTYGGSKDDGATSLERTIDGGYIVAGYTKSASGSEGIWVLKLTGEGDVEWQYAYGGSNVDNANSIQQTLDGGYIVAGSTNSFGTGSSDCWILKLRDNGKIEWQKTFDGGRDDRAYMIRQDKDQGYVVAGGSDSFDKDNTGYSRYGEFLIFKLRADGSIKWQKTYGGNCSWDDGCFIDLTAEGSYIAAGGTCSWGAGGEDIFVLNLFSYGTITPSCRFIRKIELSVTDTTVSPHKTVVEPKKSKGSTEDTSFVQALISQEQYVLGGATCTLKIANNYANYGTTEPSAGTHTYNTGAMITLKATPKDYANNTSYYFDDWEGHIYSESSEIQIIMDGDKSVVAEFNKSSGGDWGGGGNYGGSHCFIATAAYSSPQHPHVRLLRSFRDRYLLPTGLGRKFVSAYYKLSPGVASFISGHAFLRNIVRLGLLPLVGLSFLFLQLGPIGAGIGLVAIFGLPSIFIWRRKRKKRRAIKR